MFPESAFTRRFSKDTNHLDEIQGIRADMADESPTRAARAR